MSRPAAEIVVLGLVIAAVAGIAVTAAYHRLPDLHARMKDDCPPPYRTTWAAYREIVPALMRQLRDPEWYIERRLPDGARAWRPDFHGEIIHASPAE